MRITFATLISGRGGFEQAVHCIREAIYPLSTITVEVHSCNPSIRAFTVHSGSQVRLVHLSLLIYIATDHMTRVHLTIRPIASLPD